MSAQTEFEDTKSHLEGRIRSLEEERTNLETQIQSLNEAITIRTLERTATSLEHQIQALRLEKSTLEEKIGSFYPAEAPASSGIPN